MGYNNEGELAKVLDFAQSEIAESEANRHNKGNNGSDGGDEGDEGDNRDNRETQPIKKLQKKRKFHGKSESRLRPLMNQV